MTLQSPGRRWRSVAGGLWQGAQGRLWQLPRGRRGVRRRAVSHRPVQPSRPEKHDDHQNQQGQDYPQRQTSVAGHGYAGMTGR